MFATLDDTDFHLIVFGQPEMPGELPGFGALVRVYVVAVDPANDEELARAQIPQPSFYLLRPDGHIGFAGDRVDAAAVNDYLSRRVRLGVKRT